MLFNEITIKDMSLKNRIVMAPMCMFNTNGDGKTTAWHHLHYATRVVGGVGLILVEATAVSPEGRIGDGDLGLWENGQIDGLRRITKTAHKYGAKIGVQLAHAGRKCTADVPVIYAPSALAYDGESRLPEALSEAGIAKVVADFKAAAARAIDAGFDLIQIHAAHGYLINEFLSPLTNLREDAYGGGYEGRTRLLREVIAAVRSVWPAEKPLDIRITADDYGDGGNRASDLATIVNLVKDEGVDMVNVSTGGLLPAAPEAFKGYQIPHARLIRGETGLITAAGGLVTEAAEAEDILAQGSADLIYLGRELLRNPYWPLKAAHELNAEISWPEPYARGKFSTV